MDDVGPCWYVQSDSASDHVELIVCAVVGMQYYHAACIFLTMSDPVSRRMREFEMARTRRLAEVSPVALIDQLVSFKPDQILQRKIAGHVVSVIGLSWSNENVHNAYFMACHLLYRCSCHRLSILLLSIWILQ